MTLCLRLLGATWIESGSGPATGVNSRRHHLALLALLATAPSRRLSRSKLVGLLWPESAERTARNRLNTCISRIRDELGADVVISTGDDLVLNDGSLECDVWEFREALHDGRSAAAVRLYQGPFMEGFYLRGSPDFEQRIEGERARLEGEYRAAVERLAGEAADRGDVAAAAHWWRQRAELDPFDSRVTRRLMEAFWAAGNPAEALRTAEAHVDILRRELGVPGAADVEELAARIRRDPVAPPVSANVIDRQSAPPLDERAVAVLPFENIGGDEPGFVFAAGLHADLVTSLSRNGALSVISRSSVLRYRDEPVIIPEVARALGVGTVVEGEVQTVAGRVRVTVQCIDARRDVHRWAETYDRELTMENVLDIQEELATKVVMTLKADLAAPEAQRRSRTFTEDLEAYRLDALGHARLAARTERGIRSAADCFRRAIARDSGLASAWAGLAMALIQLHNYGFVATDTDLGEAGAAARRALELDPLRAEAYGALALLQDARREAPAALQSLRRAIELQPSYADAYNWISWESALLGRKEEALESARRAVRLDPLSPEAATNLALGLLATGRYEEAIREARHAADLEPAFTTGPFYEALALYELGRFEEAVALLDGLAVEWAGSGPPVTLALAHAAAGRPAPARAALERFESVGDLFAVGLLHAALGEVEHAAGRLQAAELDSYWPALAVHHLYARLWAEVGESVGLAGLVQRARSSWGDPPTSSGVPRT